MPRLSRAAGALALLLVAGCESSASSPAGSPPDIPSLGPPQPSSSVLVVASPAATPAASLGTPALARIATGATSAVDGVLGGWRADERVVEQSWVDLAALKRTDFPSDELVFAGWADGTAIGGWSIRVAQVGDGTGATAVQAGMGAGNGADFVTIGRIDAGTWILELTLTRADGRGEATYYWEILAE